MKRCSRCGESKPVEEFPVRKVRGARQSWCRPCKNAYDRDWYQRNKQSHIQAVNALKRKRSERKRELVRDAKRVPCADCGVRYPPYVMDFDHGEQEKRGQISQKVELWPVERLEAEIAKCDVVCANCHRERTYGTEGLHPSRRQNLARMSERRAAR